MKGYKGKIIHVNLTNREVHYVPLSEELAKKYIGGSGIAAKIFIDNYKPDLIPFSPDNPLIFMTGPLAGTKVPSTSRFTVSALSPLTGIWGESNSGGYFAAKLKFAGYDGIIVTGKSDTPVYLYITPDRIEIRNASNYWGMDTYKTEDALKETLGKNVEILTIGPAGENLVLYASIVNRKGHLSGRTGMGAVMGSKNLKAIVVEGERPVEVADSERLNEILKEILPRYQENITVLALRDSGTNSSFDLGIQMGDVPIKNWGLGKWDKAEHLGPSLYKETIYREIDTCYNCPVACKRIIEVNDGPYSVEKGPGPEYETVCAFGTMLLVDDLKFISKVNDFANRMGFDTITAGSTIAFLMDLYDHGFITKDDIDGVNLEWGNKEAVLELVTKIPTKEGAGALLAEGSEKIAEKLGKGKEFLTTVKGLEVPMHDPRGNFGLAIGYATSVRGGCHVSSLVYPVTAGFAYFPEIPELVDFGDPLSDESKAVLAAKANDFGMFFHDSAIWCILGGSVLNATEIVNIFNAVTGFDFTIDDILEKGERIWFLKRGISHLFGMRAKDDKLPAKIITPLNEGPTVGVAPNADKQLKEFYKLRSIDSETGLPKKEKLLSLGLTKLSDLLYNKNI